MPARSLTPCRECKQLTRNQHGLCDAHKHVTWERFQRIKGNVTQRGYGHHWRILRTRILERDNGLCVECRRNGHVTTAIQVDHIVPKDQGGTDDHDNLQSLCKPCHASKTARERSR